MKVPDAWHEEVKLLLSTMDRDHNGVVTWDEFHYALKWLVYALLTHKPTEMVDKKWDQQQGKSMKRLIATDVQVKQMDEYIQSWEFIDQMWSVWTYYDKDHSEYIDKSEYKPLFKDIHDIVRAAGLPVADLTDDLVNRGF